MIQKFITALGMALGTVFLLWVIGWIWFAAHVALIEPQNENTKTDAIVVLTGGKERIETAIALLSKGLAPKLLISGVNKGVEVKDLTKDEICCITLGYQATDTEGNASESLHWVKKNKIQSLRLVTSNYHMTRSRIQFERLMPDVKILSHPVEQDNFTPFDKIFWVYTFEEYNKTLATLLRLSNRKD